MSEKKKYPWKRYTVSLDESLHNEAVDYLHKKKSNLSKKVTEDLGRFVYSERKQIVMTNRKKH